MNINFPYTDTELTEQVNRIPNTFGLLNEMNLFPSEGMGSRFVEIRFEDGVINVLSAEEPGAPGKPQTRETGKTIVMKIPHFVQPDTILPHDLQDLLDQDGKVKKPKTLDREIAKRLASIRRNHAVTREYIRMGALKGLIKDGAGNTLYNLFTVFGINKKTVDFALGTAGTKVIEKCEEVFDHIRVNLKGETMSAAGVLVSTAFFNKLVQHEKVEKYWLQHQAALAIANPVRAMTGGNWGRVFPLGNLVFQEYKGYFPVGGQSEAALEAGKGVAFPLGTQEAMRTFDGPAHHINMVNREPGEEVTITTKILDHGAGIEFRGQSNVLAVNKRPEAIVELTTSN